MKRNRVVPPMPDESLAIDLNDVYDAEAMRPALAALYEELGGDAEEKVRVYIHKIIPATGKEARVWQGTPEEFDLMKIARLHGSGDYKVKVYAPSKRGNPAIRANEEISVQLDPLEDQRLERIRKGEIHEGGGMPSVQTIVDAAVAAIKPLIPQPTAQADPFAQLSQLAGVLKNIMPAPSQGVDPMAQLLGTLRVVRELTASATPTVIPSKDGKTDVEGYVMTKGVDLLESLLKGAFAQGTLGKPQPVAGASVAGQGYVEDTMQGGVQVSEEDQMMIQMALTFALKAAQAKQSPTEFAEKWFDRVPDEMLLQFYHNAQWLEQLAASAPDVVPHKEWFMSLRNEILRIAVEEGVLTQDGKLIESGDGTPDAGTTTIAGAANSG